MVFTRSPTGNQQARQKKQVPSSYMESRASNTRGRSGRATQDSKSWTTNSRAGDEEETAGGQRATWSSEEPNNQTSVVPANSQIGNHSSPLIGLDGSSADRQDDVQKAEVLEGQGDLETQLLSTALVVELNNQGNQATTTPSDSLGGSTHREDVSSIGVANEPPNLQQATDVRGGANAASVRSGGRIDGTTEDPAVLRYTPPAAPPALYVGQLNQDTVAANALSDRNRVPPPQDQRIAQFASASQLGSLMKRVEQINSEFGRRIDEQQKNTQQFMTQLGLQISDQLRSLRTELIRTGSSPSDHVRIKHILNDRRTVPISQLLPRAGHQANCGQFNSDQDGKASPSLGFERTTKQNDVTRSVHFAPASRPTRASQDVAEPEVRPASQAGRPTRRVSGNAGHASFVLQQEESSSTGSESDDAGHYGPVGMKDIRCMSVGRFDTELNDYPISFEQRSFLEHIKNVVSQELKEHLVDVEQLLYQPSDDEENEADVLDDVHSHGEDAYEETFNSEYSDEEYDSAEFDEAASSYDEQFDESQSD